MVLIDFWTYTCINCIRTLPYVEAWDAEYRDDGLTVVGVHSPEFPFEKDAGNVADAIDRDGIHYPVVQDNDLGTWNAFGNQYWPAKYLIDADGNIRYVHFGEGDYEPDRGGDPLAARRGAATSRLGRRARARRGRAPPTRCCARPRPTSARARAQGFVNGPQPGIKDYGAARRRLACDLNQFAYGGVWDIGDRGGDRRRRARASRLASGAGGCSCVLGLARAHRAAARCCSTASRSPDDDAGDDVHGGERDDHRPAPLQARRPARGGRHTLTLRFEPGIRATPSRSASQAARPACAPESTQVVEELRRQPRLEQRRVEPLQRRGSCGTRSAARPAGPRRARRVASSERSEPAVGVREQLLAADSDSLEARRRRAAAAAPRGRRRGRRPRARARGRRRPRCRRRAAGPAPSDPPPERRRATAPPRFGSAASRSP